ADAEAVDGSEKRERGRGNERIVDGPVGEFEKVASEGDRYGGHSAGLNDEKQHPAVEKRDPGMERFPEISVLAADDGQARSEFGVDKAAQKSDEAAGKPHRQDEERAVDAFGDEIGINEDSRADDAAHHSHGGPEKAEMAREGPAGCVALAWAFWRTHDVRLNLRSGLGQFVEIFDVRERGAVHA